MADVGETCEWKEDEDDIWQCSNCTMAWVFDDGDPKENNVNYCPQCGRKIANIIPYVEETEEDG